jgi:Uma2 family endonuclease
MEADRTENYAIGLARLFPQQGKWTEADYFALPETNQIVELANGDLIMVPAPDYRHQEGVRQLLIALSLHVDPRKLGTICVAPYDVHLFEGTVRQPDILFLHEANRQRNTGKYIEGAPDWVAEVISPGTRHTDEVDKLAEYAKAGVSEYWLIDPENRTIRVYALRGGTAYVLAGTYTPGLSAHSEILAGFEVAVDKIV